MNRIEKVDFIQNEIMLSAEVIEYLGITRPRLAELKNLKKLVPIKKGVYLRDDVEARKSDQGELREKFYKPSK